MPRSTSGGTTRPDVPVGGGASDGSAASGREPVGGWPAIGSGSVYRTMPAPTAIPNTTRSRPTVPSATGCRHPDGRGSGTSALAGAGSAGPSRSSSVRIAAASPSYRARRSAKSASETWPAACSNSSSRSAARAARFSSVSCWRGPAGRGRKVRPRASRRSKGQSVKRSAGTPTAIETTRSPVTESPRLRLRLALPSRSAVHVAPDALAHRRVHVHPGRPVVAPVARPSPNEHSHAHEPDADRRKRNEPDEEVESPARGRQEDPLAVAVHEVLPDLRRTLARGEPVADDRAHLTRHFRGRVGHGEILTDDASELSGDLVHGLLAHRRRRLRGDGRHRCADEEQRREEP